MSFLFEKSRLVGVVVVLALSVAIQSGCRPRSDASDIQADDGQVFLLASEIDALAVAIDELGAVPVATNSGRWQCQAAAVGRLCIHPQTLLSKAEISKLQSASKSRQRVVLVNVKDGSWSCVEGTVNGKQCTFSKGAADAPTPPATASQVFLLSAEVGALAKAMKRTGVVQVPTNSGVWQCQAAFIGRICQHPVTLLDNDEVFKLEKAANNRQQRVVEVKVNQGTWSCVEGVVAGKKCTFQAD